MTTLANNNNNDNDKDIFERADEAIAKAVQKFLADAEKLEENAKAEVKKDAEAVEKFFEEKVEQGKELVEKGKAELAKDLKAAADFFEKERQEIKQALSLAMASFEDRLEKVKAALKALADRLMLDAQLVGQATEQGAILVTNSTIVAAMIELDAISHTWLGGKVEEAVKALDALLKQVLACLKGVADRIKHIPADVQEAISNLAEDARLAVEEIRQHAGQLVFTVAAHRDRAKVVVGNLNDLLKQFNGRDASVTNVEYSKADHMEHAQTVDADTAELLNEIEQVAETLGMLSKVDEIKFEGPTEKDQESGN